MTLDYTAYDTGLPWYYKLGGKVLYPKQILKAVTEEGYKGYRAEDIANHDKKPEPERSEALRRLKAEIMACFRKDLSRYRELALTLHQRRKQGEDAPDMPVCSDLHTNISLKYCHLFNDFAHLKELDELLSYQVDLFGF